MRMAMTIAVLILNVWALAVLFASRQPPLRRVGWILAIVAVPVGGAGAWLLAGTRAAPSEGV